MSWLDNIFSKKPPKQIPGLWEKCSNCGAILLKEKVIENIWTCDKCDYHFRITPDEYIKLLFDPGTFSSINESLRDVDFLRFVDTKKYASRLKAARAKTSENAALKTGEGEINGRKVVAGIMDFRFIGGSISSAVGEKMVRAIDLAIDGKMPFILITQSGGARMQESTTALMQMAKTSAAIARLQEAGLPYIVILTNPTTGGATASFAMLGDIHIAEPKALIGFAGPRVIKEAMKVDTLPEGFQSSEFLLAHGFCDMIVSRKDMKQELSKIIGHLMG